MSFVLRLDTVPRSLLIGAVTVTSEMTVFPTIKLPETAGGKPPAPPKPLSPKDRRKLLSERVPKGADDPVRTDNYYDCLEETSMEADVTPPSPRKVHLPRIPNT